MTRLVVPSPRDAGRSARSGVQWQQDVPLARLTSYGIGGSAAWYAEPDSTAGVVQAVVDAADAGRRVALLGRGSNLLVDDDGVEVVVSLRSAPDHVLLAADGRTAHVGGGCMLPRLAARLAGAGVAGFDFLAGIPGTLGAGVAVNAGLGAHRGRSLADHLVSVDLLDTRLGLPARVSAADLRLRHRDSDVWGAAVVLGATVRTEGRGDPAELRSVQREHLSDRRRRQPVGAKTCGSVFVGAERPAGAQDAEAPSQAAGWYLERVGMVGETAGGARVSEKHANWIVNAGGASAADVRTLVSRGERRVAEHFGVRLRRELVYLGGPEPDRRAYVGSGAVASGTAAGVAQPPASLAGVSA